MPLGVVVPDLDAGSFLHVRWGAESVRTGVIDARLDRQMD
jgi:hypothetical protein